MKLGIQLLASGEYNLVNNNERNNISSTGKSFTISDLYDIQPVVKNIHEESTVLPRADGEMEKARYSLANGNHALAFDSANIAKNIYGEIFGEISVNFAKALQLISSICLREEDYSTALETQMKVLSIYWQKTGFDSYYTYESHRLLATIYQNQ